MNIEIKLTCNELLMHSAINEYICCTFRGILKQNSYLSAMKQIALIIADVIMARIPVWLQPFSSLTSKSCA